MSLTGPCPTSPTGSASRSPTCSPASTARTAWSPRCYERDAHRARAGWCAPRCWPPSPACTPTTAPRGPWAARCPRAGQPPRLDRPLRRVPLRRRHAADRRRQRGQWRRSPPCSDIDPRRRRGIATNRERFAHRDELIADMEKALAAHDRGHWLPRLGEAGVPRGRVRSIDEVYAWDQTRSQGLVIEVDHPVLGRIELPGPPLRFDGAAAPSTPRAAALGQHDDAVLAWLEEREGEPSPRDRSSPGARKLIDTVLDAGAGVVGRAARRPGRAGLRRTPTSWPRPARRPATTRRSSPGRACSTGAGSPSWPASSRSWPDRSGWRRPSGSSLAVERATGERLPLLAAPASGGTRMQEGAVAFVQMVKITAAVGRHRAAGPAVPGLSAPSDDRRGVRLVGVARARHRPPSRGR